MRLKADLRASPRKFRDRKVHCRPATIRYSQKEQTNRMPRPLGRWQQVKVRD